MMGDTIYCLVEATGRVYTKDGADSYAEVVATFRLNEGECQQYRLDLTRRQVLVDRGTPSSAIAVQAYLAQHVGTPERLMHFAEGGHVRKDVLVNLLDVTRRRSYLEACVDIEKRYTAECAAKNGPCLESGCSIDQTAGEICLQPLLNAG